MSFMRTLLCMSADRKPHPTCRSHAKFDIWATNPYTSGGPTHKSSTPDGVSLGDLPKMRTLLRAAEKYHHIDSSSHPVRFWVTEFSWDSKPPDPKGVPSSLLARWVSEALYRSWSSGVSAFIWFTIRDYPYSSGGGHRGTYESGLFFRGSTPAEDTPKAAFTAFRFPFVAFKTRRGFMVWGRTPDSMPGTITIQWNKRGKWRTLKNVSANGYGIFSSGIRSHVSTKALRAFISSGGEVSRPFALKAPREPNRVCPFGCP
jgi:hypothetical protein